MRIVHGAEAAREALSMGRRLDLASVPSSFLDTTERVFGERLSPLDTVSRIIDSVRSEGDQAVRDLTAALDGQVYERLEVGAADLDEASQSVDPLIIEAFTQAADRIRTFHEVARPRDWMDFSAGYGCISRACESAGIYVPGGSVPLPSTVLMTAIPARVAGVRDVLLCSPASADGLPHPTVLAAARIAGVDRVFAIGGAQAVAAMAYGTETVPPVDMVCGPGNVFVTLAKKLVYGDVGIDGLYGPTETLIVADHTANPTLCAADLLAQAEHDPMARPVLLCTSESFADSVSGEVDARLGRLDRVSIARASVEGQGCIAVISDLSDAIEVANWFAPEHMCLSVENPWSWVGSIRNAGALFIGDFSHEVLGDYVAGPSHVMPTSGTARFNSGVGVHTFLKTTPVIALDDKDSLALTDAAAIMARAEGLMAHAEAAEIRRELA